MFIVAIFVKEEKICTLSAHIEIKNKLMGTLFLRFYNVSLISYSAVTMLELSLNLPKIHGLSGFGMRFTEVSGKCVFGYEDGKNEINRWHIWIPRLQIQYF